MSDETSKRRPPRARQTAPEAPEAPDAPEDPTVAGGPETGQETVVAAQEPPSGPAEPLREWRALATVTSRDGRTLYRPGDTFMAPVSDPRTRHAVEVEPETPTAEQQAALETI